MTISKKKPVKLVAMELRHWLNDRGYSLSDLRKAQILILNGMLGPEYIKSNNGAVVYDYQAEKGKGKTKGQRRSSVLGHPGASQPQTRMVIDAEHCMS